MGLAASLNKGLSMARCELIARMDADDVSLPHRLKRQLNFMKAHPDITVCGSYIRSHSRPRQVLAFPIDDPSIRATLLFENCIAHPSVILRRSPVLELIQGYSAEYLAAQDYVLWARLCEHKSVRFATLPEPLLSYRITDASSRSPYKQLQTDISDTARKIIISNLGLACTPEQWRCHHALSLHQPARDDDFLRCCGQWLMDLRRANACVAAFDPGGLETEFHRRWRAICLRSARRLRFSGRIFLSESQEGATIRNLSWALMMRAKSLVCGA
jgi:hypothetical protein